MSGVRECGDERSCGEGRERSIRAAAVECAGGTIGVGGVYGPTWMAWVPDEGDVGERGDIESGARAREDVGERRGVVSLRDGDEGDKASDGRARGR